MAWHTGSLPDRLADAYADHLLSVTADDLPADVRAAFRDLEQAMAAGGTSADDDPFQEAARRMSDQQVREMIERVLLLYGRLARGLD